MSEESVPLSDWKDPELQDYLKTLLREGAITVDFTKVNGETRSMKCTLSESLIPQDKVPRESDPDKPKKKTSDQALRVFDVNKQEWRSFRWDGINKITL